MGEGAIDRAYQSRARREFENHAMCERVSVRIREPGDLRYDSNGFEMTKQVMNMARSYHDGTRPILNWEFKHALRHYVFNEREEDDWAEVNKLIVLLHQPSFLLLAPPHPFLDQLARTHFEPLIWHDDGALVDPGEEGLRTYRRLNWDLLQDPDDHVPPPDVRPGDIRMLEPLSMPSFLSESDEDMDSMDSEGASTELEDDAGRPVDEAILANTLGSQEYQSVPGAGLKAHQSKRPRLRLDKRTREWYTDSVYAGTLQPPLPQRLETIINFLDDEDVDRCIDWHAKWREVVLYLDWLRSKDPNNQLRLASNQTQAMFWDACRKVEVHKRFEKFHYDPPKLWMNEGRDTRPPRNVVTRLDWLVKQKSPNHHNLYPRQARQVYGLVEEAIKRGGTAGKLPHETLLAAEEALWNHRIEHGVTTPRSNANNQFERDQAVYSKLLNSRTLGWYSRDDDGHDVVQGERVVRGQETDVQWAKRRGEMRAGLQQVLRNCLAWEHRPDGIRGGKDDLMTKHRRVQLPVSFETIEDIRERTDGLQWAPIALRSDEVPKSHRDGFHTQVEWRGYETILNKVRCQALDDLNHENRHKAGFIPLPSSIAYGHPFVWNPVSAQVLRHQSLLKECRALEKRLELAAQRFPRELIDHVVQKISEVKSGKIDVETLPLGANDLGPDGQPRLIDFEDPNEQQFLELLCRDCYSRTELMSHSVAPTPGSLSELSPLARIFRNRVRRVLDDKSPQALFGQRKRTVALDELLAVLNRCVDGPVTKVQFQPHDAWMWLKGMASDSLIKLDDDPEHSCIISRAPFVAYPEHAIHWPDDQFAMPPFTLAISSRNLFDYAPPNVKKGSKIHIFYTNLALRLGYTLNRLTSEEETWKSTKMTLAPLSRDHLSHWVDVFQKKFEKGMDSTTQMPGSVSLPLSTSTTNAQAVMAVRDRIASELRDNMVMLYPVREHAYPVVNLEGEVILQHGERWDHHWDWATPSVRGQRRQFWTMDRWPVGQGILRPEREAEIRAGLDIDYLHVIDPALAEPPAAARYMRPRMQRYRDEKTNVRYGEASYPIGDTVLQEKRVAEVMTENVARAMGIKESRWSLRNLLGLAPRINPSPYERGGAEWLPEVDPRSVPASWDSFAAPKAEAHPTDPVDTRLDDTGMEI